MAFHFEDVNLVRGIFLVQEMSKILAAGQDSPLIPMIFCKDLEVDGTIHTRWGQQSNIKGGDT